MSCLVFLKITPLLPPAGRLIRAVDALGVKLIVTGDSEVVSADSLVLAVKKVDGSKFPPTSVDIYGTNSVQVSQSASPWRGRRTLTLSDVLRLSVSSSEAWASPDQRGQDLLWGPCSCPPPSARNLFLSSSSRPAGSSSASTPNLPCSWCVPQILGLGPVSRCSFICPPLHSQDAALSNRTLVGPVLGSSVANLSISNLTENIEFTIRNVNPTQASCFFPELHRVGFENNATPSFSVSPGGLLCILGFLSEWWGWG